MYECFRLTKTFIEYLTKMDIVSLTIIFSLKSEIYEYRGCCLHRNARSYKTRQNLVMNNG
jgi:hypothetical protein